MTLAPTKGSPLMPGDVRPGRSAEGSTKHQGSFTGQGASFIEGGALSNSARQDKTDGPSERGGPTSLDHQKQSVVKLKDQETLARVTRQAVAAAVALSGWHRLADSIRFCGVKVASFHCHACGHDWTSPNYCHHRLCPECAHVRATTLFKRHADLMARPHLKHLVLTVTNVPMVDRQAVQGIVAAFNRLRKSLPYRQAWRGGVRSVEFTYSAREHGAWDAAGHVTYTKAPGWHIHIHAIIDGKYIPQDKIALDWQRVTHGRGRVVWINQAKNPMQALKYILKPDLEWLDDPEQLDNLIEAIQRLHLVSGFGTHWKIRSDHSADLQRTCPSCGSHQVDYLGSVYNLPEFSPRAPPPELFQPPLFPHQLGFTYEVS